MHSLISFQVFDFIIKMGEAESKKGQIIKIIIFKVTAPLARGLSFFFMGYKLNYKFI